MVHLQLQNKAIIVFLIRIEDKVNIACPGLILPLNIISVTCCQIYEINNSSQFGLIVIRQQRCFRIVRKFQNPAHCRSITFQRSLQHRFRFYRQLMYVAQGILVQEQLIKFIHQFFVRDEYFTIFICQQAINNHRRKNLLLCIKLQQHGRIFLYFQGYAFTGSHQRQIITHRRHIVTDIVKQFIIRPGAGPIIIKLVIL